MTGFPTLRRWPFLLITLFLLPELHSGEAPDFTYRSTVEEVRLAFFATDQTGRAVSHLTSDDFAVVDNEWVVRDFRSFTPADVANLQVVVVVDASESLAPRFQGEVREVVQLISQPRWLAGDSLSVMSVSASQPRWLCAGDCLSAHPASRLFGAQAAGLMPLYDALVMAGDYLGPRRRERTSPVLVLFSDGDDTLSLHSLADSIESMLTAEARVYAVDMGAPEARSRGGANLQTLAAATGGRYFSIRDGAANILGRMLEDLHAGYVVTYKPMTREAGPHSVRILPTRNLNLQFHCRGAYSYRHDSP